MSGGFDASGALPHGAIPASAQFVAQTTTFRFASEAFCSGAGDSPAHSFFDGRVRIPLVLDRAISNGREDLGGHPLINWGGIDFDNLDGALDTVIANYPVDGRAVRVKVGKITRNRDGTRTFPALADLQTVFDGQALGWEIGDGTARLRIRDQGYRLNVPLQSSRYAGSGGTEGGSDLKDRVKPILYGYCEHVTPVYLGLIGGKATYDIGPVASVAGVYEGGAALVYTAGTPGVGEYTYNLSTGIITYGGNVSGANAPKPITVTATGLQTTTQAIVDNIVRVRAGLTSATSFSVENAAEVGIWVDQETTCAAVIEALARGIGAYAGFDVTGVYRVGVLKLPDAAVESPVDYLDDTNLFAVRRLPDPYDTPPYRRLVAYGRSWTVFSEDQVSASVLDTVKKFLAKPYRVAGAVSATVQLERLSQQDAPIVDAFFKSEADATAEAARLVALYAAGRRYQVECEARPLLFDVGHCVHVQTDELADLANGKLLRVVGISMQVTETGISTLVELFG